MTNRILLFFTLLIVATGCSTSKSVVGTYISRTATTGEAISLMYLKGYIPFLEMGDNEVKLIIEKDSSFQYLGNKKELSGKWEVNEESLILHFDDTLWDNLEFKMRKNKLYNIRERTLCKSKKKMMCLMLLEKKEEQ